MMVYLTGCGDVRSVLLGIELYSLTEKFTVKMNKKIYEWLQMTDKVKAAIFSLSKS